MATIIDREPKWYAVYTKSRNEKKVSERFTERNVEHYLPIHSILKQWSDRRKWVEEPVFKSYIFVKVGLDDYYDVLNIEGVVTFVRFGQFPEVVPEVQVLTVKRMLESEYEIEVNTETYELGDIVQVDKGPMQGLIGSLIEIQGKHKLVVHVDVLGQNILMTIPKSQLKKLDHKEEQKQKTKLQKRFLSG
ncbi:UpxY family transcription antiterminator [Bacteroidota bacterium]